MVSGTIIASKEIINGQTLAIFLAQAYPRKMSNYHRVAVQYMEIHKTQSHYYQIIERHTCFGAWESYNGVRYDTEEEAMKVFNQINE